MNTDLQACVNHFAQMRAPNQMNLLLVAEAAKLDGVSVNFDAWSTLKTLKTILNPTRIPNEKKLVFQTDLKI